MPDKNTQPTRKGSPPIKVYCLPAERKVIEAKAKQAGMSMACYLREVGQGYKIAGIVDYQQVRELARINGDLGRLGGLLKLWLTNDEKTAAFTESTIRTLLGQIDAKQEELGRLMLSVVIPREDR